MSRNNLFALLPSELELIVECCRVRKGEENNHSIARRLKELDFSTFIAYANRHGVLPFVYCRIKKLDMGINMPYVGSIQNLLNEMKSINLTIAQKNMLMSAELIRIMTLFKENDIEALAFKGPTLSLLLYGNVAQRQYGDLDILIRKKDGARAAHLLEAEGYKTFLMMSPEQETVWYENAKEMVYYHSGKKIHIDLQWQFFDNDYPLSFDTDTIWKTARQIDLNGRKIKTFAPELLLIYLCLHGSKHLWERIGWIKDIDVLVRSHPLDWQFIKREMEHSSFERMFLLGLYMTHTLFDTPLPREIREQFLGQKWLRTLENFIIDDWTRHKNMLHNTVAMLQLFPTAQSKLHYLYKVILKPSKNEYRAVDLPEGFRWAYFFIRPFLLAKKYLFH